MLAANLNARWSLSRMFALADCSEQSLLSLDSLRKRRGQPPFTEVCGQTSDAAAVETGDESRRDRRGLEKVGSREDGLAKERDGGAVFRLNECGVRMHAGTVNGNPDRK